MSGLTGRRVLVTREADKAAEMISLLEDRGASAVLLPTIGTAPARDPSALRRALDRLSDYDWIVFTSATAVHAVFDELAAAGAPTVPTSLKVAAVGTVTAASIRQRGAAVHVVPSVFRGAEIARAIGAANGVRVLLPQADIARPETVAAMRTAGALVDDVVAYHTVLAERQPKLGNLLAGVDALTFTSPSTVHGLSRAAEGALSKMAARLVVASIGPTTSAAARAEGLSVHVEPAEHTVRAMIEDLHAWFAASAGGHRA